MIPKEAIKNLCACGTEFYSINHATPRKPQYCEACKLERKRATKRRYDSRKKRGDYSRVPKMDGIVFRIGYRKFTVKGEYGLPQRLVSA